MGYATKKQLDYAKQIADTLGKKMPDQRDFDTVNKFISDNRQDFYQVKNQQMRDTIVANISILSIAQEIGLTPIRKGHYYSLKEHDSVMINPDKNCYWRNSVSMGDGRSAQGGSVIDFMHNFTGMSMTEVMKNLADRVRDNQYEMVAQKTVSVHKEQKVHGDLVLPEASYNMRRAYAYLTKTRMIDPDIVQHFVDRKMLYQDTYGNCVFVSRDENSQPVFACKRGTNTERRFVGDVANSDYSKGFFIDNHADKLVVSEAVIDTMSIMQIIDAKGIDYTAYDYLPLCGATKFEAVMSRMKERAYKEVHLALDDDEAGRANIEEIKKLISEHLPGAEEIQIFANLPEYTKDWNEEIKYAFSHQIGCRDLDFFHEKKEDERMNKEQEPIKSVDTEKIDRNIAYTLDENIDY